MRSAFACALAAVFAYAGAAKAANRHATVSAFAALGVPAPPILAVAVPAAELAVATLLVAAATVGAVAALAFLVAASTQLALARAHGVQADCGCFGRRRRPLRPAAELLRNLALGLLAVTVLVA